MRRLLGSHSLELVAALWLAAGASLALAAAAYLPGVIFVRSEHSRLLGSVDAKAFLGSFTYFLLRDAPLLQLMVQLPLGLLMVVTSLSVIHRRAWALRCLQILSWLALAWLGIMSAWLVQLAWTLSSLQRELTPHGGPSLFEPAQIISSAAWLLAQIMVVVLTLWVLGREGRPSHERLQTDASG